MTPDQIRQLRVKINSSLSELRKIQYKLSQAATRSKLSAVDFVAALTAIEQADAAMFQNLFGPRAMEIRAEAQRLKLRNYWSRAASDMLIELRQTKESVYYEADEEGSAGSEEID